MKYQILDLNAPTDRELEAKIIQLLDTYKSSPKMYKFFQDIYQHFFDIEIESSDEEDDNDEKDEEDHQQKGGSVVKNLRKIVKQQLEKNGVSIDKMVFENFYPDKDTDLNVEKIKNQLNFKELQQLNSSYEKYLYFISNI